MGLSRGKAALHLQLNADFWSNVWGRHLQAYLTGPARTGRYLHRRLGGNANGILEIAAGSGRDSIFLFRKGYDNVLATDFCSSSIIELQRLFPDMVKLFQVADANALPFRDKSFDVVFHNGFFVLVRKDDDIVRLIREQLRIARRWLVVLVHNGHNRPLVREYGRLAVRDSLYDVRFFLREELLSLCVRAGVNRNAVRFEKFGGPADILTAKLVKGLPNPAHSVLHAVPPFLYPYQPWPSVERIACWIKV